MPIEKQEYQAEGSRSAQRFYRPELDILRFFAFGMVFLCHSLPTSTASISRTSGGHIAEVIDVVRGIGGCGMCMFFFLSSYLISELLLREKAATGTVHIKAFYTRRILRIWPLYFTVLIVGVLLGLFFPPWHVTSMAALSFVFMMGNIYTAHFLLISPIDPLWSISLEEQFYLLWPSVARFGGRKGLAFFCTLLLPLSAIAIVYLSSHAAEPVGAIWRNSFVQFGFFAVGGLTALVLGGRSPKIILPLRLLMFLSGITAWVVAYSHFQTLQLIERVNSLHELAGFSLIGLGCISIFLSILGAAYKSFWRPFVYLGKISYGLYVFHDVFLWTISALLPRFFAAFPRLPHPRYFFLLNAPLALTATIFLASLSYRYLETPALKLKERFTFIKSRPA